MNEHASRGHTLQAKHNSTKEEQTHVYDKSASIRTFEGMYVCTHKDLRESPTHLISIRSDQWIPIHSFQSIPIHIVRCTILMKTPPRHVLFYYHTFQK